MYAFAASLLTFTHLTSLSGTLESRLGRKLVRLYALSTDYTVIKDSTLSARWTTYFYISREDMLSRGKLGRTRGEIGRAIC